VPLQVLVVRFGSLGDVILAGAAVQALRDQRGEAFESTFLVKSEYGEMAAALGQFVWTLGPGGERDASALAALRERIRGAGFVAIIDL